MNDQTVLIAGAGPVGVLNALGLAQAGIRVTLMERGSSVVQSPRAMVYHWSVLEGLENLGILEEAVSRGFTKQDYTYKVYKTGEEISFGLQPLENIVKHPHNLHLGQNALVEIALEKLRNFPNAEVLWNTSVQAVDQSPSGVQVSVIRNGAPEVITGSWLIGADGAGSTVRSAIGLEFEGITWPERFVATNLRFDFEKHGWGQTTLLIDDQYGAIVTKIDTSGLWRYTYCEDATLPVDGVAARMPAFFDAVFPGLEGIEVEAFSPYSMHQRAATSFRKGRVLLAGDAAHATNPTGGLGLTSGLFDTYVLYEALAAVICGDAPEEVLDRYAEERRKVFLEIASPTASNNKRLVYHSDDPVRLEEDLAALRQLTVNREALMTRLMFPKSLETPSLISTSANPESSVA